jgi:hypothetical protein
MYILIESQLFTLSKHCFWDQINWLTYCMILHIQWSISVISEPAQQLSQEAQKSYFKLYEIK